MAAGYGEKATAAYGMAKKRQHQKIAAKSALMKASISETA